MCYRELVFTIIRIVILLNLVVQDIPWDFFLVFIWTNVQEAIGIVCICLPALGPLLKYRIKSRAKSATNPSKHSLSRNLRAPISMGTVTCCERVLDRRSDSITPAKETIEKPGSLMMTSYWKEESQETL